ncbi:MAG: NAD(P)/FAD-dependent oxidoreductase [Myxococcota bacterium]
MTVESTPCLIVGAGPAGISAAQWLVSLHVPFRWVTRDGEIGGFLHSVHNTITNYPGGIYENGRTLAHSMQSAIEPSGADLPEAGDVTRLSRTDDGIWLAEFTDLAPMFASTVILATGTRYRHLGVPGEEKGLERGYVSQSGTRDAEDVAGKHVAVVGGGDSGFENAIHLSDCGCRVSMLLRNDEFKARPEFVTSVTDDPNIDFYPFPTRVTAIDPADGGARLTLDVQGDTSTLDVACLFVKIGVEPVMPTIDPAIDLDGGFIVVDDTQMTSQPGLFAAGDVIKCPLRAVTSAVGTAADATKAVAHLLDYA